jgi:hypothetical protein
MALMSHKCPLQCPLRLGDCSDEAPFKELGQRKLPNKACALYALQLPQVANLNQRNTAGLDQAIVIGLEMSMNVSFRATVRPDDGSGDFHSKIVTVAEQGTIRSRERRSFTREHPCLSVQRLFSRE